MVVSLIFVLPHILGVLDIDNDTPRKEKKEYFENSSMLACLYLFFRAFDSAMYRKRWVLQGH